MSRLQGDSKMMLSTLLWMCAPFVFGNAATQPKDAFFLQRGDRVVFLGDSITQSGIYTKNIELFVTAYHPELRVQFFNAGKNSGTAQAALERLKADVLSRSPTVVTVSFGINDAALGVPLEDYLAAQRKITHAIRDAGAKPVLLSPSCLHEYDAKGKRLTAYGPDKLSNDKLGQWTEALKRVAADEKVLFVDLFHPLRKQDVIYAQHHDGATLIPDGVHPSESGMMILGMEILRAWGFVAF
jgi:lysophospholipase L1-like esterase